MKISYGSKEINNNKIMKRGRKLGLIYFRLFIKVFLLFSGAEKRKRRRKK